MAAWLDTSLETGACSDLILDWREGGKQPSTRSVTFQHSALRSWFEEPDDKKQRPPFVQEMTRQTLRTMILNLLSLL